MIELTDIPNDKQPSFTNGELVQGIHTGDVILVTSNDLADRTFAGLILNSNGTVKHRDDWLNDKFKKYNGEVKISNYT